MQTHTHTQTFLSLHQVRGCVWENSWRGWSSSCSSSVSSKSSVSQQWKGCHSTWKEFLESPSLLTLLKSMQRCDKSTSQHWLNNPNKYELKQANVATLDYFSSKCKYSVPLCDVKNTFYITQFINACKCSLLFIPA